MVPVLSSAHTLLPGARSSTPHFSARASTINSPRPDSAPGSGRRVFGRRFSHASATSIRTVPVTHTTFSRKLCPETYPCMAALVTSSAATSTALSYTSLLLGMPQACSRCATTLRASRAPRRLGVKSCLNSPRTVGVMGVVGVSEFMSLSVVVRF